MFAKPTDLTQPTFVKILHKKKYYSPESKREQDTGPLGTFKLSLKIGNLANCVFAMYEVYMYFSLESFFFSDVNSFPVYTTD